MNMNIAEPDYLRTSTELTIQSVPPNPHFLEFSIENFEVKNPRHLMHPEILFMDQLHRRFAEYQVLLKILRGEGKEEPFEAQIKENKESSFVSGRMTTEQELELETVLADLKFLWDLVKDLRRHSGKALTEGDLKVFKNLENGEFEVCLLMGKKLSQFLEQKEKVETEKLLKNQDTNKDKTKKLNLLKKESLLKNENFKKIFPKMEYKDKQVYFQIKADGQILFESEVFDSVLEKYSHPVELNVARYYPLDHLEIFLHKKGLFGGKILSEKIDLNSPSLKRNYLSSEPIKVHFESVLKGESQKVLDRNHRTKNSEVNTEAGTSKDVISTQKTGTGKQSEGTTESEGTTTNTNETTNPTTGKTKTTKNTGGTDNTGNTQETKIQTEQSKETQIVKIDMESPEERIIEDWLKKYDVSSVLVTRLKKLLGVSQTIIEFDYTVKVEHLYDLEEQKLNTLGSENQNEFEQYLSLGQTCTHTQEGDSLSRNDLHQKVKQCIICQNLKKSYQESNGASRPRGDSKLGNDFFDHWFVNRNLCDPRRFVLEFAKKEGIEALLLDSKKLKNFFRITNKSLKKEILKKVKLQKQKSK